jgi:hypothetical protein
LGPEFSGASSVEEGSVLGVVSVMEVFEFSSELGVEFVTVEEVAGLVLAVVSGGEEVGSELSLVVISSVLVGAGAVSSLKSLEITK